MTKKKAMGRNLNALLGGSRARTTTQSSQAAKPKTAEKVSAPVADNLATENPKAQKSTSATQSVVGKVTTQPQQAAAKVAGKQNASQKPVAANKPKQSSNQPKSAPSVAATADQVNKSGDRFRILGTDQLRRGDYQPRTNFASEKLQELADSLTAQGIIQPILVRPYGDIFEIIAGERRWRAAQLAGISEVPVIVRHLDDKTVAAISLIENIQRADLKPLEEARAFERLCEEFSMTHQAVAESVGRSRVAVSNLLRLLDLSKDVQGMLDNSEIDMGHARALLGLPVAEQLPLAKRIVKGELTVRAVEKMVKAMREVKPSSVNTPSKPEIDPNIEALRRKLSDTLGAPVNIKHKKNGAGVLEISYTSLDELDGILAHIK